MEGVPVYLRGRRNKKERNMIYIARFRCGNEMRSSQYWKQEKDKKCRIWKENLIHLLSECEKTKEEIIAEELLRSDGKGEKTMRRIERKKRTEMEEKEIEKKDEEDLILHPDIQTNISLDEN